MAVLFDLLGSGHTTTTNLSADAGTTTEGGSL
jgi:hypothetical protein